MLTENNLRQLMRLVNEELGNNGDLYREEVAQIDQRLGLVDGKLANLYAALESGKVDIDDLAPRIKELRTQQRDLKQTRDGLLKKISRDTPPVVDLPTIRAYVSELQELLINSSFSEQKPFLRSFIKRIEFRQTQIAIDYTIPLMEQKGKAVAPTSEVLPFDSFGSPEQKQASEFRRLFLF